MGNVSGSGYEIQKNSGKFIQATLKMRQHIHEKPRIMKKLVLQLKMTLIGVLVCCFSTQAQHHHNKEGQKHQHKPAMSANEYMHQSSVKQLAQRFDSPERDAYQQPEKVLAYLGDIRGKKIMDIGAGSGYFSIKLAQAGAEVIAADVNDEFQDYLRSRLERENLKDLKIALRKIPYDSPELKSSEVDMVFLANTYHHIEDRVAYFAKVKNGLGASGELFIIDYFKTDLPVGPPMDHKISMDQVVSELKAAGFSDFEVEVDLLPYQFIFRVK